MCYIVAFVVGSVLGSFFSLLAYRIPRKMPFIMSRSMCESCHEVIPMWNNIPIISYLVNGGRCRNCNMPIAPRIFLFEIFGAIFSMGIYSQMGFGIDYMLLCFIFGIYGIILSIDINFKDIHILCVLFVALLELLLLYGSPRAFQHILSSGILFLLFLLIFIIFRNAMGFGDVLLSIPVGLISTGLEAFTLFRYIFCIGAIYSLYLLIFKGAEGKDAIAFAPFMILGGLMYVVIKWICL